jgi:hypothetical protein
MRFEPFGRLRGRTALTKIRGGGENGVAMTEFALVLPVFIVVIVGLLSFGRVLFYWIEANHLANETVRWAVVDRRPNPSQTLQEYALAQGGTVEFHDATVCVGVPDADGDPDTSLTPVLGQAMAVEIRKPFSFVHLKWFDVGHITITGRATMRIERFDNGTAPTNYTVGCVPPS